MCVCSYGLLFPRVKNIFDFVENQGVAVLCVLACEDEVYFVCDDDDEDGDEDDEEGVESFLEGFGESFL
jgi:hypothetical protein